MIVVGFSCLGLLVGVLTGLTSSPIATTILAAVFTLAGGSLVPLLGRSQEERKLFGSLLSGFALFCLLGVLSGIFIKANRILTRPGVNAAEETVYLKSAQVSAMDTVNMHYRNREISADEAYRQLWTLVQQNRTEE